MDFIELARTCADRISDSAGSGLSADDAAVCLVVPKGWKPPPRFPRGRTVQVKSNGDSIRYFPAAGTLTWLMAHSEGRFRVETSSDG